MFKYKMMAVDYLNFVNPDRFLVDVWDRAYRFYNRRVFPVVSNFRGSELLRNILESRVSTSVDEHEATCFDDLDWDVLLVLDACRQDLYEDFTGVEESRVSSGSTSKEVIAENFSSGDWSDTVLITANPYFCDSEFKDASGKNIEEVFHHVFRLFEGDESWSDKEGTVLPRTVAEKAHVADTLFPDKRKLVWFMQPHYPFLSQEFEVKKEDTGFWSLFEEGDLDKDFVWRGFKENLEIVLSHVDSLSEELEGNVVVTSDHGNYFGEYGLYGHPYGRRDEAVRRVPVEVVS